LPMAFFDRAITGQLVSRVTNDTEAVKKLYIQVLFSILDSTIVLLGTTVAMAWLDWRLMTIVLALLPAVLVIVWLYQRLSAPAVTRARALRSDINAQMAESIGGMTVLQASNAAGRFGASPRSASMPCCCAPPSTCSTSRCWRSSSSPSGGARSARSKSASCTPSSATSRAWSSR
jgi:ABC-type multidrug transport system fused ATPase/permease subunit